MTTLAPLLLVVGGSLVLGLLFAVTGQLLALGLHHPMPFSQSFKHAAWLAVAVLVLAKVLSVVA